MNTYGSYIVIADRSDQGLSNSVWFDLTACLWPKISDLADSQAQGLGHVALQELVGNLIFAGDMSDFPLPFFN
jgi:hypothetical protein